MISISPVELFGGFFRGEVLGMPFSLPRRGRAGVGARYFPDHSCAIEKLQVEVPDPYWVPTGYAYLVK
jgi:hypothetical protein